MNKIDYYIVEVPQKNLAISTARCEQVLLSGVEIEVGDDALVGVAAHGHRLLLTLQNTICVPKIQRAAAHAARNHTVRSRIVIGQAPGDAVEAVFGKERRGQPHVVGQGGEVDIENLELTARFERQVVDLALLAS